MSEDKKEQLAAKVKKLLALATSSNPHEAGLAAEKARKMLEQHNMTLTDVEIKTAEMTDYDFRVWRTKGTAHDPTYTKVPQWVWKLTHAIQPPFNIKVLCGRRGFLHFLGAKEDVQVASYTFNYLTAEVQRLADRYVDEHKKKGYHLSELKEIRYNYTHGAASEMASTLYKMAKKQKKEKTVCTVTGTELTVVKQDALQKYFKAKYPRTRKGSYSSSIGYNSAARAQGQRDGAKVQIRRGVNDGRSQKAIKH